MALDQEPSLVARIERIEEDYRELRSDIRALTGAVADLAKSNAVLSERIAHLPATSSQPVPRDQAAPAMGLVGAGAAIGGAIAAKVAASLGLG